MEKASNKESIWLFRATSLSDGAMDASKVDENSAADVMCVWSFFTLGKLTVVKLVLCGVFSILDTGQRGGSVDRALERTAGSGSIKMLDCRRCEPNQEEKK